MGPQKKKPLRRPGRAKTQMIEALVQPYEGGPAERKWIEVSNPDDFPKSQVEKLPDRLL